MSILSIKRIQIPPINYLKVKYSLCKNNWNGGDLMNILSAFIHRAKETVHHLEKEAKQEKGKLWGPIYKS